MRLLLLGLLVSVAMCVKIAPAEVDQDMFIITEKNFAKMFNYTRENEGALLMYFYDEGMSTKDDYIDEYQKAAQKLSKDGDKIYLGKVSRYLNQRLAQAFKVFETPNLVILASNEGMLHRYYEGEKTSEDIIEHMRRIIAPGPNTFNTLNEFYKVMDEGRHHLVAGFFEDPESQECKAFIKAGVIMRYVEFIYTTNTTLGEILGLETPENAVALFYKRQLLNSTEPRFVERKDKNQNIFHFVSDHIILTVDIYDKYNDLFYKSGEKIVTMVSFEKFDYEKNKNSIAYYRTEMEKLNDKLHLYTDLAIVSEDDWRFTTNMLDLSKSVELIAVKNLKWYKSLQPVVTPQNTFDPVVFEEFVYDVYYDRIDPFVKSEPVPENNYTNGILNLVGKNIDKFVTQPGHESIVMLYVTWNPRCKQFRKELEKLANGVLKNVPNFHIVQMDTAKNYVPSRFPLDEMPTVYFIKDGVHKRPMKYAGKRTAGKMLNFIEQYSDIYPQHQKLPFTDDL